MLIFPDQLEEKRKDVNNILLKITAIMLLVVSFGVFIFFGFKSQFQLNYYIVMFSILLFVSGLLLFIYQIISNTESKNELTFDFYKKYVRQYSYLAVIGLYGFLINLGVTLLLMAPSNDQNQYGMLFLVSTVLSCMVLFFSLHQRSSLKQHYHLHKQNLEIIEKLSA